MSTRKNFAYNLVLTASNYIFPLITYPYVSRVLGVTNLGICNYVDSIIQYFILFSTLGIVSFGVREIARYSNDFEKCSRTFSNLFAINLFLTVIAACVLVAITLFVPHFSPYRPFLFVGLVKLFANLFLTEWFFQGIQQFKYITIRSIAVRLIYVVSIFCFVRDADDSVIYYILTVLTIVLNGAMNWRYSLKFRKFSLKGLTPSMFIMPILVFGYYRILTSMYTTFNVVFLGSVAGDTEVGYFTTATKLYTIIMSVFTAITTVMVPRISQLIHEKKKQQIQEIADQIFSALEVLSIPIIVFSQFYADEIIYILSGAGYEGAIVPFKIVIFMLLIIGFEQVAIQQFLMATTSNKSVMIVSTIGAIVGITLNMMLTGKLGSVGSSLSWGLSEFAVLITGLILIKKLIGVSLRYKDLLINGLYAIAYIVPLYFVDKFIPGITSFFVSGVTIFLLFILVNLKVHPNTLIVSFWNSFKMRIPFIK